MSKKKKNSNYKGAPQKSGANAKKSSNENKGAKISSQTLIIIIACAAAVLGIVAGIISTTLAKRSVYVEMDFGEYGTILIEVDKNAAPKTAKNFISLVKSGFYDGLTIFRAQKNFVIQGGRNDSVKLDPIYGEFNSNGHKNPISHQRGVISMARSGEPDSATSQFFITLHNDAARSLDGEYAAFGHVVEGMEVVDAIASDLFGHSINDMGFVNDDHAITIVSAKVVKR
jgi:peptidyl-prolyl cis-trans isomerase B (cyclophilin B)